MKRLSIQHKGFNIHKYDTGEIVHVQIPAAYPDDAAAFHGHRGELHEVVFEHARKELGIPIHLNNRIDEYFEHGEGAGIILASGEKVRGVC